MSLSLLLDAHCHDAESLIEFVYVDHEQDLDT